MVDVTEELVMSDFLGHDLKNMRYEGIFGSFVVLCKNRQRIIPVDALRFRGSLQG